MAGGVGIEKHTQLLFTKTFSKSTQITRGRIPTGSRDAPFPFVEPGRFVVLLKIIRTLNNGKEAHFIIFNVLHDVNLLFV